MRITALLVLGVAAVVGKVAFAESKAALQTVPHVDLTRYVGRWYEIARYPTRFEKDCASDVTATYTQLSGGKIEVLNECRKADGQIKRSKGTARCRGQEDKCQAQGHILLAVLRKLLDHRLASRLQLRRRRRTGSEIPLDPQPFFSAHRISLWADRYPRSRTWVRSVLIDENHAERTRASRGARSN